MSAPLSSFSLETLTLETAHSAIAAAGGRPSRLKGDRFYFRSICHGGTNPAGAWAVSRNGVVTLHCHSCPFPESDRRLRAVAGLPEWTPPYTADKPGYGPKPETRSWSYQNPATGETCVQVIDYYPAGQCRREGCGERERRHKHPRLERGEGFAGESLAGFALRRHDPPADMQEQAAGRPLIITEGQDAADKAAAAGYVALSYLGGAQNAAHADYSIVAGRSVVLLPDRDMMGAIAALEGAMACLQAGAAAVAVARPAPGGKGADIADLPPVDRRSYLEAAAALPPVSGRSRLRYELAAVKLADRTDKINLAEGNRPRIDASNRNDLRKQLAAAWAAVHQRNGRHAAAGLSPALYRNDRNPALIGRDNDNRPRLERAETREALLSVMSEIAFWHSGWAEIPLWKTEEGLLADDERAAILDRVTAQEGGWLDAPEGGDAFYRYPKPYHPNNKIVSIMAANASPDLPVLRNVTPVPYLAEEGLVTAEGYNSTTEIYLDMSGLDLKAMTAARGVAIWRDLFTDFPLIDESDFAGVLALALTPIVHHYTRLAPLALLNKPTPRTGASLLSDVIFRILLGGPACDTRYSSNPEEMDKILGTVLLDGRVICRLDNISLKIGTPLFNAIITAETADPRILGTMKSRSVSTVGTTWVITGNALQLGREMLDRSHLIRQNARSDKPGERTGPSTGPRKGQPWKYPQIIPHALEQRSHYLSGLFAIVQAWLRAGRPAAPPDTPMLGGFERWRNTVGGILSNAGVSGFLENRQEFDRAADAESADRQVFIETWWEQINSRNVNAAELLKLALGRAEDGQDDEPLIHPDTLASRRGGAASSRTMADWLTRNAVDHWFKVDNGELLVECVEMPTKREKTYSLRPANSGLLENLHNGHNGHNGSPSS